MDILNKLEKPELVVAEKWKERSEHFGQIRYDTFGQIELKNNDYKEIVIEDVDPYDLTHIIDTILDASMYIKDDSLMFSAEVVPIVSSIKFDSLFKELFITYRWKEV